MRYNLAIFITVCAVVTIACPSYAQSHDDDLISPSRPVPTGKASSMQVKEIKNTPEEQVYAVVFYRGDEVLSGLTDFAIQHKIGDAHFTESEPSMARRLHGLILRKKSIIALL